MISSAKMCSHFLAVADKEGRLMEFLSKLGRNSIKPTNLCTLANTGKKKDVSGKKGQLVMYQETKYTLLEYEHLFFRVTHNNRDPAQHRKPNKIEYKETI